MPGDAYPKFRAAAVQAAPVFLDRDASIDKIETLVRKAVDAGAQMVVFGESFIPAFPVWNLIYAPSYARSRSRTVTARSICS